MTDIKNMSSKQRRAAEKIARGLQPVARKFLVKQRESDTRKLDNIKESREIVFMVLKRLANIFVSCSMKQELRTLIQVTLQV